MIGEDRSPARGAATTTDRRPRIERRLPPSEVAARLTWMVLDGTSADADAVELVRRGIGGAVLFGRNVDSPAQVSRLVATLRGHARAPFRVAIDQEGGHIVRLGAPLTRFPSAMAIGATRSPALAYAVARASGLELAALGVDVVLAPVLDVASDPANPTIGSRSFGSRPGLVALLGAAAIRGYLDGGVVPTPKHFPGHGRTPLDSHLERPAVRGGIPALAALDLPPFQAAIAAGAPIVMISHVAYEGLTHGLPATLSRGAIGTLLRSRLGFRGVALTDAMVMDAVADGRAVPDACVDALDAGADVVMPLEPQRRALVEIERAILRGRLDEARIAASLDRLDALDARVCLAADRARRSLDDTGRADRVARHAALAALVARRSLTLVRGSLDRPVDAAARTLIVEFASRVASPIEDASLPGMSFAATLCPRLPRATAIEIAAGPGRQAAEARAISLARASDVVVVATRDNAGDRAARMLVAAIAATGRRIVHVALRSPADLAALSADVAIASYSDVPASLEALASALTEPGSATVRFPGVLPMTIDVRERAASSPSRFG